MNGRPLLTVVLATSACLICFLWGCYTLAVRQAGFHAPQLAYGTQNDNCLCTAGEVIIPLQEAAQFGAPRSDVQRYTLGRRSTREKVGPVNTVLHLCPHLHSWSQYACLMRLRIESSTSDEQERSDSSQTNQCPSRQRQVARGASACKTAVSKPELMRWSRLTSRSKQSSTWSSGERGHSAELPVAGEQPGRAEPASARAAGGAGLQAGAGGHHQGLVSDTADPINLGHGVASPARKPDPMVRHHEACGLGTGGGGTPHWHLSSESDKANPRHRKLLLTGFNCQSKTEKPNVWGEVVTSLQFRPEHNHPLINSRICFNKQQSDRIIFCRRPSAADASPRRKSASGAETAPEPWLGGARGTLEVRVIEARNLTFGSSVLHTHFHTLVRSASCCVYQT